MVSKPLVPSVSVHEKDAVPSVVVVRDALATDVAVIVNGLATVDSTQAPPVVASMPPTETPPMSIVNVVVDGTVSTVTPEPVVGVAPGSAALTTKAVPP